MVYVSASSPVFSISISKKAPGTEESSSFRGMKGLKARRSAFPGKCSSEKLISATGNVPRKVQFLKCGSPASVSRSGPKPKPLYIGRFILPE